MSPRTFSNISFCNDFICSPFPLELKHGEGGYIWIEPSEYVEHITGQNHIFSIRDKEHHEQFYVTFRDQIEEL